MREKREREAEKERVRRQLEEDRLAREAKVPNWPRRIVELWITNARVVQQRRRAADRGPQ